MNRLLIFCCMNRLLVVCGMYRLLIFCLLLPNVVPAKVWMPRFDNENTFDEPFDYVDESHLPDLSNFGSGGYDWIGVAGTALPHDNKAYVAFSGSRKNINTTFSSVYTRQSGIIVMCSIDARDASVSGGPGFLMNCRTLEEHGLNSGAGKYFGANVRSLQFQNDTVAFMYCDPLWNNPKLKDSQPSGKCRLTLLKDLSRMKHQEFEMCGKFERCLGGFSVDLVTVDQDLWAIFGLPMLNSTYLLKQPQSHQIAQSQTSKGTFFNFGYSVAFDAEGISYIGSPVSDEHSPFVTSGTRDKIYPPDINKQRYGGFGTSIDTVAIARGRYAVVIGSPHQSNNQSLPNVGAVYLACNGRVMSAVYGERAYDYFGYVVARLGDLDGDNRDEFVVSAPRLNMDEPGRIYVYGTTSDCKIPKRPRQVFRSNIHGFGVAISRGVDIDMNGLPDFFVTSLGHQRPALFKMPNQKRVSCQWLPLGEKLVYVKDSKFVVKTKFGTPNINYGDYVYQVATDLLNENDARFRLVDARLEGGNTYSMTFQALQDVQDMDVKGVPLQIAVRGVRSCKIGGKQCYMDKAAHINWFGCDTTVLLSQSQCKKVCESELSLAVRPDAKGSVIYYGMLKDYQRSIELTISNNGPDKTQRVFLSIDSRADLLITNVRCNGDCKKQLTATGQHAKIIIKSSILPRETKADDVTVVVDVLYNKLDNVSATTAMEFRVWGINNDNDVGNNAGKVEYSVLFRPNLTLAALVTNDIVVDQRLKPPYLEVGKRISTAELGTELRYSYLIENKGLPLKNVALRFTFPLKVGEQHVLYMMDKTRLSTGEEWRDALPSITDKAGRTQHCSVVMGDVNPLHLIGMEPLKTAQTSGAGGSGKSGSLW